MFYRLFFLLAFISVAVLQSCNTCQTATQKQIRTSYANIIQEFGHKPIFPPNDSWLPGTFLGKRKDGGLQRIASNKQTFPSLKLDTIKSFDVFEGKFNELMGQGSIDKI
jgi:hypothetical protein